MTKNFRNAKENIFVIFEGLSEELFLKKLCSIFDKKYNIKLIDAKGKDKIPKAYLKTKKTNPYSKVIVLYDLDYVLTSKDIQNEFKRRYNITIKEKDIFFVEPRIELVFVLCKEKKLSGKNIELKLKRLYGLETYSKKEAELKKIMSQINIDDINFLLNNVNEEVCNYKRLIEELYIIEKE